jgi:hypothetical protein
VHPSILPSFHPAIYPSILLFTQPRFFHGLVGVPNRSYPCGGLLSARISLEQCPEYSLGILAI